jgi:hypothetical protein
MITAMSPEPSDEVVQRLYESLDEEMLLGATEVLLEEGEFRWSRSWDLPKCPAVVFCSKRKTKRICVHETPLQYVR